MTKFPEFLIVIDFSDDQNPFESFTFYFDASENSENDAWKVAEKLLSNFPENTQASVYETINPQKPLWSGEVISKQGENFFISGSFR